MLYEKAPTGHMSLDANGHILQVNDALLKAMGTALMKSSAAGPASS